MPIDYLAIRDAVVTKAQSTGIFLNVLSHEPLSAPQEQGAVAAWAGLRLSPSQQASSLADVGMRAEAVLRIYQNGLTEPQDLIDFNVFTAADQMMGALIQDAKLVGVPNIFAVDVLGMSGDPMRTEMGWTDIGQTKFRIADIYIPILLSGVWNFG